MLSKLWDVECTCSTNTHRNFLLPSMLYPDAVSIYSVENNTVTYRAKKSGLSEEFLEESPPRNRPVETKNQQFHGCLATQQPLEGWCVVLCTPYILRAEAQTLNIKHSTEWKPHNSPPSAQNSWETQEGGTSELSWNTVGPASTTPTAPLLLQLPHHMTSITAALQGGGLGHYCTQIILLAPFRKYKEAISV